MSWSAPTPEERAADRRFIIGVLIAIGVLLYFGLRPDPRLDCAGDAAQQQTTK